jgi:hypothetical protein
MWAPSPLNSPPPRSTSGPGDDIRSPPVTLNISRDPSQANTCGTPQPPQDLDEEAPTCAPIEDLFCRIDGDELAIAEERAAEVRGGSFGPCKAKF